MSCLSQPDLPSRSLASENVQASLHNSDKTLNKDSGDVWLSVFPYLGKAYDSSYIIPLPGNNQKKVVDMVNKCGGPGLPKFENEESNKSLQSRTNNINLEHHKVVGVNILDYRKCGGQTSGCKDTGGGLVNNSNQLSHDSFMDAIDLTDVLPAERVGVDFSYFPSNPHSAVCNRIRLGDVDYYQNGMLHASEASEVNFQKDLKISEFQTESGYVDTSSTSLKFPAGYELHEALGPAFLKRSKYFGMENEKTEGTTPEMPEQMSSSQLTSDSRPEHLLEAVVASVCQSGSDVKSEKSFCKSVQSLLTSEKYPEPSSHTTLTMDSSNYSIDQPSLREDDRQHFLSSSGICGVMSPKGFSSTCPSACSEQLDRSSGPAKNNKKRSRPGENCRPRPRDRQLIQDRIKELRELIPNGAKVTFPHLLPAKFWLVEFAPYSYNCFTVKYVKIS